MNRQECEELILRKLKEIESIYHEYNPKGEYLSLSINDGYYAFNNSFWMPEEDDEETDWEHPIHFFASEKEEDDEF